MAPSLGSNGQNWLSWAVQHSSLHGPTPLGPDVSKASPGTEPELPVQVHDSMIYPSRSTSQCLFRTQRPLSLDSNHMVQTQNDFNICSFQRPARESFISTIYTGQDLRVHIFLFSPGEEKVREQYIFVQPRKKRGNGNVFMSL